MLKIQSAEFSTHRNWLERWVLLRTPPPEFPIGRVPDTSQLIGTVASISNSSRRDSSQSHEIFSSNSMASSTTSRFIYKIYPMMVKLLLPDNRLTWPIDHCPFGSVVSSAFDNIALGRLVVIRQYARGASKHSHATLPTQIYARGPPQSSLSCPA